MNLRNFGITAAPGRKFAGFVEVLCPLGELQLAPLLAALPVEAEISTPDPDDAECSREVRRTARGLEFKRGCHGAYGTWREAPLQQCVAWLAAGIPVIGTLTRPGYGARLVIPEVEYEG
jgi:hypothetical protein